MNALANIQEAHTQVTEMIAEHLTKNNLEECTTISIRMKEAVEQVKSKDYDNLKVSISTHMISS